MIQSMTGYGKATVAFEDKKIHVEIKSLNSKAMDISTRIAPLYREKEIAIRNIVSQKLERGKVDVNIWIEKEAADTATPINVALVDNYYHQIMQISQTTGIPCPQDWFYTLLRMPDVLTKADVIQELTEDEWLVVKCNVEKALDLVIEYRKVEGLALEKKFNEKIENIRNLAQQLVPFEQERITKIRERITEALEKSLNVDYDKNRLEQELIFYIEKLDINEEKQRLAQHLNYFLETMNHGKGQGKKLGFIAQEMGREINTTGSKSNQAEMQQIVVQMKDELEQIKEQVLNVM